MIEHRFPHIVQTSDCCGNFYNHVVRLGRDFKDYKFCTLDDDWIEFYRKVDRFNMDICQYCLANGKVWEKVK